MQTQHKSIDTLIAIQPFPDGNLYLILEDSNGYRFIQDYKPYAEYGLKPGAKIICKVDKVNCNGKIFLEPQHPLFEEGKDYPFPVIDTKNYEAFALVTLIDSLGKKHFVFTTKEPSESSLICTVIAIHKGQIDIEPADVNLRTPLPRKNDRVESMIEEIVKGGSEEDEIVILSVDKIPLKAPRRCLPYKSKAGEQILCLVRAGSRHAEPIDPNFPPGLILNLSFQRIETRPDLLRGPKSFILAEDEKKNLYEILISPSKFMHPKKGDKLVATIKSYRCGRPVLEPLEPFH